MTKYIPLELLAPAGDAGIGIAAVSHGADAVYIGAPKFGARSSAGNSISDIERLVKYAHRFRAKVYVALNTIMTDSEIEESLGIVNSVYNAGVDGLIIQDVGLLEIEMPPIPIIASTQMHNSTPQKVKFLEDVGVKRVILARELSFSEIADIRRVTSVELECFVHGALCVCYSGQCYLSQVAFGRSGNRGVCAQPCRHAYTLEDGNGRKVCRDKYLLSLKDLCLIEHIPELVNCGVTSFKIEGRYKDITYVKNVVAAYRLAIDEFLEHKELNKKNVYNKSSSGSVSFKFVPDVNRTFHRSYTKYFANGASSSASASDKHAEIDTPKSVGDFVGVVTRLATDSFCVSGDVLHNGDGICFLTRDSNLIGFRVDQVEGDKIYPNSLDGLWVGAQLYRNKDHEFAKLLGKHSARRSIVVDMIFSQTNSHIALVAIDEDGNVATLSVDVPYEKAKNTESMEAKLREKLTSAGDTDFTIFSLTIEGLPLGFVPLSVVNKLRRDVLEQLAQIREENYNSNLEKIYLTKDANVSYPDKMLDYRANVLNRFAIQFYARHGASVTQEALEAQVSKSSSNKSSNDKSNVTLTDEALMISRYCIRRQLDACLKLKEQKDKLKEPLHLSDGQRQYRLCFDCKNCLMSIVLA